MKKSNLALSMIALIAGTISSSNGQKPFTKYAYFAENLQEASNDKVDVTQDLKGIPKNLNSEYQKFKNISEIRIHNNEKVFADFKVKLSRLNQLDKVTFRKMVSKFEQENSDLKNKLVNYKKDEEQAKWKTFKRSFNHDMDVLGVQMWSVN